MYPPSGSLTLTYLRFTIKSIKGWVQGRTQILNMLEKRKKVFW